MADSNTSPTATSVAARNDRRVVTGIVTSAKTAKTRRVETQRLVRHPKYGKFIKQRTVCYVHDEKDEAHLGDTVEIMECRPMSRTKRWRLVRIVTKAPSRTLSNLEGAVAGSEIGSEAGPAKDVTAQE
jgi:small subunit ribosomal protein S17